MKTTWDRDENGNLALSVLTGFGLGILSDGLIAVQMRTARSSLELEVSQGHLFQIGMTANGARELATALLQAADRLDKGDLTSGPMN